MLPVGKSLRANKVMLAVLALIAVSVVFFYWNQSLDLSSSLQPSFDRLADKNRKLVAPVTLPAIPLEGAWTYKCMSQKCIRNHYVQGSLENAEEKRVSFTTCAMTCGSTIIVPEPTIKNSLGLKSVTFGLANIKTSVKAYNSNVKQLLSKAITIFIENLHILDNSVDIIDEGEKVDEQKTTDKATTGPAKSEEHTADKCKLSNCDINSFDIKFAIDKSDEIYLSLETDESYNLTIEHINSALNVKINAKTFFGARHALESLFQLIWFDDVDNHLRIISEAQIEDAPKFKYRGLMLDTSRHYFSVESIKRTLRGMAHSKLNRFHWHITDSQSFPYLSKHYPQLAIYGAYSSHEVYTPENVREIVEYARVRGIQVVPEIDAPAHAGNGWDWGPKYGMGELSLCINQQPWNFYCGEPPCGQLNPKNNHTYTVLQKLYSELLEATGPVDFFHLGGDEVNLECWAQHFNDTDLRGLWCDFMLQTYNQLRIANKGLPPKYSVVWSSGLTSATCLNKKNFAVQVWGGSTWQENYDLIDNGFNVIISHVDAWYLDCGFGSWRSLGEGACSPYRTWQNVFKHRPWARMRLNNMQMKQILGGEACLWTEQVDETTLDSRLWPRSAALAERLWTDPNDDKDFDMVHRDVFRRISVFRNRLLNLGIMAEPIFPKFCAQNQDECM